MSSPKISVIIPVYNAEEFLEESITSVLNQTFKDIELVCVNDGSKDKTEEICIKNNLPHINLIHNLGIGGAVQTGYKYAYENNYDIAIQFDGDGQHDVTYVPKIIEPILKGETNMVIGSRFVDKNSSEFKSSGARRMGIRLISFFIKLVTKKKVYDTTSGFRAVDKSLIEYFARNYPVEYPEPVSTTQILKEGFSITEVPVSMNEREEGVSSIRAWKSVYYMINVILSILVVGIGGRK